MKPFANETDSFSRTRNSFCSRTLLTFALMYVGACGSDSPVATGPRATDPVLTGNAAQSVVIDTIKSCPALIDSAGQYMLGVPQCSGIVINHSNVALHLNGYLFRGLDAR